MKYSRMGRFGRIACLAAWAGCATVAVPEPAGEHVVLPALGAEPSLQDYLKYAELNNAGLKAAFHRWQAALERVVHARSLPDPRFTYAHFIEQVETRVGPQRQKLALTQGFPWFGTLKLRGDAASAAAAAARQDYEKAKRVLFYRVKDAYYAYAYLAQQLEVTRRHMQLVTNLEGVARIRFKAGSAPHSAVIQAQLELAKLDDRLRALESMREPVAARLKAALNLAADRMLPWPRALPERAEPFTDVQARRWLAEGNPELARLAHLATKAGAAIKLAGKKSYPDIMLGVEYIDTGDALNPAMKDSGKDPVVAMVSINVPIWLGKYRAAQREAGLRKAAVEQDRKETAERLEADLALALYRFRDAERKIDLYRNMLLPKAEQSLGVARQEFEAGKTSFIALVDAQRLLLDFQLAEKRARADRGQRLAEIEMLVGKDLRSAAVKPTPSTTSISPDTAGQ